MDECFVIMPISTPVHLLETYGGERDHFIDVYEYLFKPAIEAAELKPVPPAAKGSELIQGEIIKRIEEAPLVLCDMSALNPNVFFELGIRTALNKPVCLVKDNVTPKVPFDTGIINHHTYRCKLTAKELKTEIPGLAAHIRESIKTSDGANSMWKYFGLSSAARPAEVPEGVEAKLSLLSKQIEAIRSDQHSGKPSFPSALATPTEADLVISSIIGVLSGLAIDTPSIDLIMRGKIIQLHVKEDSLPSDTLERIRELADVVGWTVHALSS